MKSKNHFGKFLSLSLLALVGCSGGSNLPPTVPAEGVVTLDGVAVEQATVVFIAEQGTYNATGITDKDGKFALKAFDEKPGAVVGSYKVEINKTVIEKASDKGGESQVKLTQGLPKKYATIGTSGLTSTIPEKGTKELKFELKSK